MAKNEVGVGSKVRLTEKVLNVPKGTVVELVAKNADDPTLFYFRTLFFVPVHTNQFEVVS